MKIYPFILLDVSINKAFNSDVTNFCFKFSVYYHSANLLKFRRSFSSSDYANKLKSQP